jgi:hypothetical protein
MTPRTTVGNALTNDYPLDHIDWRVRLIEDEAARDALVALREQIEALRQYEGSAAVEMFLDRDAVLDMIDRALLSETPR